jgi:hypothetical protein
MIIFIVVYLSVYSELHRSVIPNACVSKMLNLNMFMYSHCVTYIHVSENSDVPAACVANEIDVGNL